MLEPNATRKNKKCTRRSVQYACPTAGCRPTMVVKQQAAGTISYYVIMWPRDQVAHYLCSLASTGPPYIGLEGWELGFRRTECGAEAESTMGMDGVITCTRLYKPVQDNTLSPRHPAPDKERRMNPIPTETTKTQHENQPTMPMRRR